MSSASFPRCPDVDVEKNDSLGSVTSPPIILSWHDLTLEINGKAILSSVSGELASGQMLAVMGPSGMFLRLIILESGLIDVQSGAGKSSFVDVRSEVPFPSHF